MSEAYWFGGFRLEKPAELPDALQGLGFQPGWIEEIHWVNALNPPDQTLFHSITLFEWPRLSHPLRLLHLLLNELIHAQRHTLLWVERDSHNHLRAAVLGSPVTVGRFNLPPQYRLLPLPPASGNWPKMLAFWQSHLNLQAEIQTAPNWLIYPPAAEAAIQISFPHAERILPPYSDTCIEQLAAGLETARSLSAGEGLWIDERPPHLALFIERR
ncbi:hypothetical protein BECAL_03239 [Bellilinea caldifistulae]|uniref:Uncharacterized protein n=1 Tax=Bellilinea caldifistulae TaxID=360411 RepID=A0A0N8GMV5_9CHLR|nr:hypothetical protein [Bellilinea caldifistulae]KPL76354.1 hypothetical protein AC812_06745 [Bellilinea caldifistulae]GAP12039.1 hypothetical protein BECAL_03239 [Bellilinea caldifistulae]